MEVNKDESMVQVNKIGSNGSRSPWGFGFVNVQLLLKKCSLMLSFALQDLESTNMFPRRGVQLEYIFSFSEQTLPSPPIRHQI
jgi:hypothetical protein